jgi:hypothetical protein
MALLVAIWAREILVRDAGRIQSLVNRLLG